MPRDDDHAPMIQLEPGGVAPIISYNVPEPTAYSGRNFIDLQLPASYFIPNALPRSLSAPPPVSPLLTPAVAEALAQRAAFPRRTAPGDGSAPPGMTPAQLTALLGVPIPAHERLSPELAQLDLDEVLAMRQAGKHLTLYRSLTGTLTYTYLDPVLPDEPAVPAGPERERMARLAIDPNEPEPIELAVAITSPAGGATITGPHTGATVTVTGTAQKLSGMGSVGKVEVQLGSAPFRLATTSTNWATWSFSGSMTTPGPSTITAKVTHSGGFITDELSIAITVALTPPPDAAAPTVSFTSPTGGAVLTGPSTGVPVTVTGTAADVGSSGVRQVEVSLDNSPTFTVATPRAPGDWSSWTRPLTLTIGAHTITARCSDNAGNVATAAITVTAAAAPPPDTTRPAVTITTPAAGTTVSGQFPGVTVSVTGTASDAGSGVRSVELTVDNNPAWVDALPRAPGDWSQWSGSLLVTEPGAHVIAARCSDNAAPPNVTTASLTVTVSLVPEVVTRATRLILVESYRLSSYLGRHGAGRTIRTFSLLPGEKTKISVKTYTRRETNANSASSVFDSLTEESARDFEESMGREQSNKQSYEESFNYKVGVEAQASWGWGSATASGTISGGSNAAREAFAKNITNATQKHAAKASAKRDIQINTSYEVKEQTGEETAIERELENVNVSRTLNFVFRQMNQEFITILHLVDVRLGFFKVETVNGEVRYTYREFSLPQLPSLLADVIVDAKRTEVRDTILHQLGNIFDYKDAHHCFYELEQRKDQAGNPVPNSQYLRVKKGYTSLYRDEATGTQIRVPGIILAANQHVMRTEGVIVEALLGQGDALDAYSHGLQDEAVRAKRLANDQAALAVERGQLALRIIRDGNAEAAMLYQQLFPQTPVQLAPYVLTPVPPPQNGQPSQAPDAARAHVST